MSNDEPDKFATSPEPVRPTSSSLAHLLSPSSPSSTDPIRKRKVVGGSSSIDDTYDDLIAHHDAIINTPPMSPHFDNHPPQPTVSLRTQVEEECSNQQTEQQFMRTVPEASMVPVSALGGAAERKENADTFDVKVKGAATWDQLLSDLGIKSLQDLAVHVDEQHVERFVQKLAKVKSLGHGIQLWLIQLVAEVSTAPRQCSAAA